MTFFHSFFWQHLRSDSYKKRNLGFSTCRLENIWKTVIKQTFIDTEFKKLFVNLRRFCVVWQLAGILIFISTFLAVWLCVYPLRQLTITRQVTKRNKLLRKPTKLQRWADERQTFRNKLNATNTRLLSPAGWRALSGFCARIHFVVSRQRMLTQTARAHSLGRYGAV